MEEFKDAAFFTYLASDQLLSRKELVFKIQDREGVSRACATALVEGIIRRHHIDLVDLKIVGSKDCGLFTAHATQGGGISFRFNAQD